MTIVPAFPARPGLGDVAHGFALPFKSLRIIFGSRRLLALALVSALVTLVALVSLLVLLARYSDDLVLTFWQRPDVWYALALWQLLVALVFLAGLVIGMNAVPLLLLAPLQDPMSEATEALCGEYSPPPFSAAAFVRGAFNALGHNLRRIALLIGGHLLLWPLHFVPGIGSMGWSLLSTAWTVWWLCAEYLSGAMSRHLYAFRDVRKAMRARRALALGFGLALYLLLWIPLLNLLLIPVAVVAGTLLFRGLRRTGDIALR